MLFPAPFDSRTAPKYVSTITESRRSRARDGGYRLHRAPLGTRRAKDAPLINMELSRRQFMAGAGAGLAGTTLGALGFGDVETAYANTIRPFKLVRTTETRNTCPYCSVACGII